MRNLRKDDLEEADTILRLSFGTSMGLDDPMSFFGDADYVRSRYATDPNSAFAIEVDGTWPVQTVLLTGIVLGSLAPYQSIQTIGTKE